MASIKNVIFFATFGLLMVIYVHADSAPANSEDEENTIKIYKRLIPADVLRGKKN